MWINLESIKSYILEETLASRRSKTVFGAPTHSYMIMPVLVMDGMLFPHMYVLVSEPNRQLPDSMIIDLPNVKAYASKSANITKRDL
ncbi:hypothetical protein ANN_04937 [Periplaneta americana]|uniref:Uncharacterized protein n=1 Tax=Periplaneta americana TaxID=6978 RepID=A0ABQ8TBD5_PERAM|nr:hypothetical protein ANN_04937 [Periplaneta americana]